MRCKVGDLAVVVQSHRDENLGAFVEIVRYVDWAPVAGYWLTRSQRPILAIDATTGRSSHCLDPIIHDRCLRPIRDEPGHDETLGWVPVPVRRTVVTP